MRARTRNGLCPIYLGDEVYFPKKPHLVGIVIDIGPRGTVFVKFKGEDVMLVARNRLEALDD